MPLPFPGMNPYLEHPELWLAVHSRLIVAIADDPADMLSQDYPIEIEKRTYWHNEIGDDVLIDIPDVSLLNRISTSVDAGKSITSAELPSIQPTKIILTTPEEVTERYLEIREVKTGKVITAIEILSPKNKKTGEGKEADLRKRRQVLQTETHLIEIDLLRINPSFLYHQTLTSDYRILISRSHDRPDAVLYSFSVCDGIPDIPILLRLNESEPILDLQTILHQIYQRGRYDPTIDYDRLPKPALSEADQEWARRIINHG